MDKSFALIVEEDRKIAALFQGVLETAGFHTETVSRDPFVFERLFNRQPWLVVLDLPGISGNLILERIR